MFVIYKFAKGPLKNKDEVESNGSNETSQVDEQQLMGCAPYLQIFKGGKLLHTAAASLHVQQSEEELPFVQVMDGTVPFNINQIIQGDILIRCRHLTFGKKRVSMFRAGFHTGYAPPNVLRLTKSQLDGACHDKRYNEDFFLDLIFEKADADDMARIEKERENMESFSDDFKGEKGKGPVVRASDVDSMLQGNSRFWDVISSKKQEHVKQTSDPFWGPTVGRRRGDSSKGKGENNYQKSNNVVATEERNQLKTFSIGNEFDFLPVIDSDKTEPPTRDSLMDALNALDEEETPGRGDAEEIVFDTLQNSSNSKPTKPIFDDQTDAVIADRYNVETVQIENEKSKETVTTNSLPEDSMALDNLLNEGEEIDALLASAEEDFEGLDLADFDDDDDLEDLENMLKT